MREVTVEHEAACPRCDEGPHAVTIVAELTRGTLLFGGPGEGTATAIASATVVCPATGLPFEVSVTVPTKAGERVQTAHVEGGEAPPPEDAGAPAPPAADWRADELAAWRKGSADQARDAAAKLLGAGTAAVGAHLAILKYVGSERVHGWSGVLGFLPAAGYLAVCVLATLALRPVLLRVYGPDDFERLREERLRQLDGLLSSAVLVFVGSTALAIVAYAVVWQ